MPRTWRRWALTIATMAGAVLVGATGEAAGAAGRRWTVRAVDGASATVLGEAIGLSPTVRRQVAELDRLSVIVYLRVRRLPRCRTGQLRLIGTGDAIRYLLIEVSPSAARDDEIAWLGHELQHALEIARSHVSDEASLDAFYRRIGHLSSSRAFAFETDAAIDAGRAVHGEVRGARSAVR